MEEDSSDHWILERSQTSANSIVYQYGEREDAFTSGSKKRIRLVS